MAQRTCYDLAVIGSGPGGYRAAQLAAMNGLKVALIERHVWGGCCLNRGCVPKKAWYAIARGVCGASRYATMGITGRLQADLAHAWAHQRRAVDAVRDGYLDYLARLGVSTYRARAAFESPVTLALDGVPRLDAGHIVIATGSAPALPATFTRIPGRVLTTDELFEAEPPAGRRVAVIGSGAVATELTFILAMLGCEVSWLARGTPLKRLSYSVPALHALDAALSRFGITPRHAEVRGVHTKSDGAVMLRLDDGSSLDADWVLLGTGRSPHTGGLALERAGLALDGDGYVQVDDHCRTADPRIYAIGDVSNARMSANHALADAAVAVANILHPGSRVRESGRVPDVIYSAVEMAQIGLNQDEAEQRGLEPAIGFSAFESNPAARAACDTEGFVRLVAEADSGALLGAEVVGADAGDTLQLIANVMGDVDALRRLARACYNHPARGEEVLNAVESLASRWGMRDTVFGNTP